MNLIYKWETGYIVRSITLIVANQDETKMQVNMVIKFMVVKPLFALGCPVNTIGTYNIL